MLSLYISLAWRNIVRHRQFSFLNLLGLSTGLASAITIYIWAHDQLQVDKYNEKDDQLYQVLSVITADGKVEVFENTPGLLADALKKEMPEVEYATAVIPSHWFSNKGLLSFAGRSIRTTEQFVSKDYFDVFSCKFLTGNRRELFATKQNIAISHQLAIKLFGSTDNVIGRTVEYNQENFSGNYIVSGIFESLPNATAKFDVLLNYDVFLDKNPKLQHWNNSDPSTYIILKKGTKIPAFISKIEGFIKTRELKSTKRLFVQRFSDRYLYNQYENGIPSGGRIAYIKLFSVIAIFIVVIASINFMTLSTASAIKRMKEASIKKVMGASRMGLILQYLGESMFMVFLSLLVAMGIVFLVLPFFEDIAGKEIAWNFDARFIMALVIFTFTTGMLAGSYPAVYLSGVKDVFALKGSPVRAAATESLMRKGLVVFQLTVSIILIVSVLVVYQQMKFIQTKNLGYEREHIIYFEKGGKIADHNKKGDVYEKELEVFLEKVKSVPGVMNASNFRHSIVNRQGGTTAVTWPGKEPDNQTQFTDIPVGYDFIETLGIEMKEGRTYSRDFGADKSSIIFNEAAIESMGIANPIGKTVKVWGEDKQIIGVTKNFHFESLYENIKPCFFDLSLNHRASRIMVRIQAGTEQSTIERLENLYRRHAGEIFQYKFLDDDYQALYVAEQRVAILSRYFAAIALVVSCLGLFGLAAFTAQKRQKEIGIRKVIGASVSRLVVLLIKEFLFLLLIALLIAIPTSWWIEISWLQNFAYRIKIQPLVFVISGACVIIVTLLTISFQSIKAAAANPAKTLRSE